MLIPFNQWLEYLGMADQVDGDNRVAEIVQERLKTSGPEHWVSEEEFMADIKNPRNPDDDA